MPTAKSLEYPLRLGLCIALAVSPMLVLTPRRAFAGPVSPLILDPSFGTGGVVRPFPDGSATAVVVQADGDIVAVGLAGDDFALVRLTPDGIPDPSFGTTGVVTTDLGDIDSLSAMAIQPDGKIVAVGNSGDALAVARYTLTGTLDAGFGSGGVFTTTLPSLPGHGLSMYRVRGLTVEALPNGGLLVGGAAGPALADMAVLICVGGNGAPDLGCGPDGVLSSTSYSSSNWISALGTEAGGQILVVTNWYSWGTVKAGGFNVTRLNADLSPDPTYGTGGAFGSGIHSNTNDLVTVAGHGAWLANVIDLLRLTEDGLPDPNVGDAGWLRVEPYLPRAVALRPNGEVASVGWGTTTGYTTSDTLVLTFDPTGHLTATLTLDLGAGSDYGQAIATQSDGAIVVAGQSDGAFFVARVTGEPFAYVTLPAVFNNATGYAAPADARSTQSRSRPRRGRAGQPQPSVSLSLSLSARPDFNRARSRSRRPPRRWR